MKLSVCMATYNGEKYIRDQISSILNQLNEFDELIISDDGSNDNTVEIINSFKDKRIHLLHHKKVHKYTRNHYLVSANFENALNFSSGDVIFLSDQDDIWVANKVEVTLSYLKDYSLVMSDFQVIDNEGKIFGNSFFKSVHLPRGLFLNISRPIYHGSCMAFKKEILNIALPFPKKMILHDNWIGILAEKFSKVKFIDEKLILYRRHFSNFSFSAGKSENSLLFQVSYRIRFFFQVVIRLCLIRLEKNNVK